MAKLIIKDGGHLITAIKKAIELGKLDNLVNELDWLAGNPEDWKTEVELFPELNFGAPPSFGFVQRHLAKDGYTWSNGVSGGVIFHNADQTWSTHT